MRESFPKVTLRAAEGGNGAVVSLRAIDPLRGHPLLRAVRLVEEKDFLGLSSALRPARGEEPRESVTDAEGKFRIERLPPGGYLVNVLDAAAMAAGKGTEARSAAATIGSQASGPVKTSTAGGQDTGHQGSVAASAGRDVDGRRRQPGTSAASATAAASAHHGAGAMSLTAPLAGSATLTSPAAHQAATPTIIGPTSVLLLHRLARGLTSDCRTSWTMHELAGSFGVTIDDADPLEVRAAVRDLPGMLTLFEGEHPVRKSVV